MNFFENAEEFVKENLDKICNESLVCEKTENANNEDEGSNEYHFRTENDHGQTIISDLIVYADNYEKVRDIISKRDDFRNTYFQYAKPRGNNDIHFFIRPDITGDIFQLCSDGKDDFHIIDHNWDRKMLIKRLDKELEKIKGNSTEIIKEVEEDNEDSSEETEESFHADSLKDFLQKTETKLSVKKEGCEPSPIFGSDDMRNHNKYRIKLTNKNGSVSFVFWDSIKNTEDGIELDEDDALGAFGIDCSAYDSSMSFEDFKSQFGYDDTDDNRAQKAYNGCRKQMEKAKKMFSEDEITELIRLSNER